VMASSPLPLSPRSPTMVVDESVEANDSSHDADDVADELDHVLKHDDVRQ